MAKKKQRQRESPYDVEAMAAYWSHYYQGAADVLKAKQAIADYRLYV
jgi:hypothetical protein